MSTIASIGWWAGTVAIIALLILFAAAAFGEWEVRRHRAPERILEYLSGKRNGVPGSEIREALNLSMPLIYVVLNQLEDEGAVISEPGEERLIGGTYYAIRLYRATGTRMPDESESIQPVFGMGIAS